MNNKPTLADRNKVVVSGDATIKIVLRAHHLNNIFNKSFEEQMGSYRPKTKKESEFLNIVFNSDLHVGIWYELQTSSRDSFVAMLWNEYNRANLFDSVAFAVMSDDEFPELYSKEWRKASRQWFKDNLYPVLQPKVDKVLEQSKAEEAANEALVKNTEERLGKDAKVATEFLQKLGYVVVPPKAIGTVKKPAKK